MHAKEVRNDIVCPALRLRPKRMRNFLPHRQNNASLLANRDVAPWGGSLAVGLDLRPVVLVLLTVNDRASLVAFPTVPVPENRHRNMHMATDTAAPPSTTAPTDSTRHLWQIPVLLLGIGVFVGELQGWIPLKPGDPGDAFERDLNSLKAAYEKHEPNPTELKTLLSTVAGKVETFPEQAPRARFHLGSGYVRLAEITAPLDESREYWMLAHQHFNLVSDKQLRDPMDLPKLAFRKAKANAVVGL